MSWTTGETPQVLDGAWGQGRGTGTGDREGAWLTGDPSHRDGAEQIHCWGSEADQSNRPEMCRKHLNKHIEPKTEGAYSRGDTLLAPGVHTRAKGISIWKSHVRSNRACKVAPLTCVHRASVTQRNTGCHHPGRGPRGAQPGSWGPGGGGLVQIPAPLLHAEMPEGAISPCRASVSPSVRQGLESQVAQRFCELPQVCVTVNGTHGQSQGAASPMRTLGIEGSLMPCTS